MPFYICDAMLAPIRALGIEIAFYTLDEQLAVSKEVTPRATDCLLYVNYFGICGQQTTQLLRRIAPEQVILDHSQAFFCEPKECLATIYSPRKFFGIPDGGLLVSSAIAEDVVLPEDDSMPRTAHLLKRLAYDAERGYADFQASEATLADTRPRAMSTLTQRLLSAVDTSGARARRNENFRILHDHLGHLNLLNVQLPTIDGPLCYPFVTSDVGLREALMQDRIYAATYWPEVLTRCPPGTIESRLVRNCLPLPCDQRYDRNDMERIVAIILSAVSA
ncbi:hypothetical protein C7R54_02185 [Achromobacter aloeverae]|uniref:DegT/DnrJ/EryC1/StrS aminotransferase family protein n=2 Tax=Achromobacter aloeverae TaxID=1750518 RepID=A0A4Q1HP43_9BURK|nr:hypothetical protein C7R54_02185 [Achromobacter aloeverae]